MPLLLLCIGIIIISVPLLNSCQKLSTDKVNSVFTTDMAKEWYYGSFKKTTEFGQSSVKGKQLPDWQNGTYRKVGKMEIVEFPLIKEKTKLTIPQGDDAATVSRIADASLTRIAFIKAPGDEIDVREIDYVPDGQYLANMHYDISKTQLGAAGLSYSGRVIAKKWGGEIVTIHKLTQGKVTAKGRIKKQPVLTQEETSMGSTSTMGCVTAQMCEYEQYCEEIHRGDVWVPNGKCTDWSPTGYCIYEEYCDPYTCDYGSTESCECQLYGLGCSNEGGGGDNGNENNPDSTINPCAHADSLAKNSEFKAKLDSLKGKSNGNKEYGYYYKENFANTISEVPIEGPPDSAGINFSVNLPIDGFMHNHYSGLLSVFSVDDLASMAKLYVAGNMINPGTFTISVVTASNTQYLLKIDNEVAFAQFAASLIADADTDNFEHLYQTIYGIKKNNTAEKNEKNFLQFLEQVNSGLRLFKGNSSFNSWTPLKVDDNGNIVVNPC